LISCLFGSLRNVRYVRPLGHALKKFVKKTEKTRLLPQLARVISRALSHFCNCPLATPPVANTSRQISLSPQHNGLICHCLHIIIYFAAALAVGLQFPHISGPFVRGSRRSVYIYIHSYKTHLYIFLTETCIIIPAVLLPAFPFPL